MHNPVVGIIGAGPVGLEAAAFARLQGYAVKIFERGQVGNHLRQWGHVRLFTPWSMITSSWGRELIPAPETEACPTGHEFLEQYLLPLASHSLLAGSIHEQTRVLHVGRHGRLKQDMGGRTLKPFRLVVETPDGERAESCDFLIDAGGVYGLPNSIGADGIPAPGERDNSGRIVAGLPSPEELRHKVEGKDVVIVGSGMSACTSVEAVCALNPKSVVWLTRRRSAPVAHIPGDPLAERKRLIDRALAVVNNPVRHVVGTVSEIKHTADGVELVLENETLRAHTVLANTGFRPDWEATRELQVHHCYATEGPMKLAAALDPAGDCLTQTGHGPESLTSPEPGFFVLGHKSYGRRSDFLLRSSYQQIQDAFTLITQAAPPAAAVQES